MVSSFRHQPQQQQNTRFLSPWSHSSGIIAISACFASAWSSQATFLIAFISIMSTPSPYRCLFQKSAAYRLASSTVGADASASQPADQQKDDAAKFQPHGLPSQASTHSQDGALDPDNMSPSTDDMSASAAADDPPSERSASPPGSDRSDQDDHPTHRLKAALGLITVFDRGRLIRRLLHWGYTASAPLPNDSVMHILKRLHRPFPLSVMSLDMMNADG